MGWQWHQLDHMQIICTSLHTDKHTSTPTTAAQQTASKHWRQSFPGPIRYIFLNFSHDFTSAFNVLSDYSFYVFKIFVSQTIVLHPSLTMMMMTVLTRHTVSTSMYSLILCVSVTSPERHHRKPAVQATAVMLITPPLTASYQLASHARFPYTACNFENAPVTRRLPAGSARTPRRAFAVCRHITGWMQACN